MSTETTTPRKTVTAARTDDRARVRRFLGEESGQVLPWVVVVMVAVLGIAALSVDLGRAMVVERKLQASADATALAAAEKIDSADYSTFAQNYSGGSGDKNAENGINVGTPTITPLCLTTVANWGVVCGASVNNANAVQVTQTATINTLFAQLLGKPTLTLSATSTASPGRPTPLNIALIVDTTASMDNTDSNCGSHETQLTCAFKGAQELLQGLAPSLDYVSLFTFPGITTGSVSTDYGCSGQSATDGPYTFPSTTATSLQNMPLTAEWVQTRTRNGTSWSEQSTNVHMTYQVVGYTNDYRASDTAASLSSSSDIVKALGGKSGCSSMHTSDDYNTYYAATIYAAQASLLAEQAARTAAGTLGSQNIIILLSDGNATAMDNNTFRDFVTDSKQSTAWADNSGNYPNTSGKGGGSWIGECGQGVDAAQYAATYSNDNTTVYTIAYGSPSTSKSGGSSGNQGNCSTDIGAGNHPGITPCEAMQQMSSGWPNKKTNFYSDFYDAAQGDSGCQAADQNNTITSLNNIFSSILNNLIGARLIPNGTP